LAEPHQLNAVEPETKHDHRDCERHEAAAHPPHCIKGVTNTPGTRHHQRDGGTTYHQSDDHLDHGM